MVIMGSIKNSSSQPPILPTASYNDISSKCKCRDCIHCHCKPRVDSGRLVFRSGLGTNPARGGGQTEANRGGRPGQISGGPCVHREEAEGEGGGSVEVRGS